jgi:signal transduction histidine kinase/ligand-binding sensor domain-containing protein/HPt (histidine-containing phosphotransfer) domain-containing protein
VSLIQRFLRFVSIFACLCAGLWSAAAAAPALAPVTAASPARSLRFEQLTVEQGLPQESVLAMVQDQQGFMWFGSQDGLSRYDGYRITTFRSTPSDPTSLADNWVRVLYLDQDGQLWVGTDSGLDRYDAATQRFTHFKPGEQARRGNGDRHIHAIASDGGHGLWIATADGLQHFDPASGVFKILRHAAGDADSLGDDRVNALARDATGRLWIGTESGIDMLAPGATAFKHFQPAPAPGGMVASVQALLIDAHQALWIGGSTGLERWDLATDAPKRRHFGAAEGMIGIAVTVIYQDGDANLWVGSYADGLYRLLPQTGTEAGAFLPYRHLGSDSHSIADNRISALYRDRVGTFWVGTWYGGVSRVDLASGGFSRYVKMAGEPETLSDNKVRSIIDAGHGRLWLGTNGGLNLLDPASGRATVFPRDPDRFGGADDEQVTALWRGGDGTVWVGGRTGLHRFDPGTGKFSNVSLGRDGDPGGEIRGIMGDREGLIWTASRGGLHSLDPNSGRLRTYRHDPADPDSLADDVVRPMLEDSHGQLWLGTFNGLDLLDRKTGRFRHFRHDARDPSSLSHDEVHYLYEDRDGSLWVGTAGGLNHMQRGADGVVRFKRYTRQDGLADDAIAAILGDGGDALWLSTNSGLSQLNKRSGQFRNYSGVDGTIEGAYFDGAALAADDGVLYFGGFNGMTAFSPAAIHDNHLAPAVVITDFQIFNKPVRAGQGEYPDVLKVAIDHTASLTLRGAASVFSLEFAALHYAAPQRNRFAFQLQGFDADWVLTDASKRFATYTNLDPGQYVFRVKAANKDGVWNDDGATLNITILPPVWKTWWFRLALALLLLGSAWLAYQARMRSLSQRRAWLETEVGLRTNEVEQKNRLLQHQADELERRRLEAENQRVEAVQRRIETERQKQEVELQKENVEQAHRNISVLSEIGRELTATLDMETAMSAVYRHVHQLMDGDIFGIGFYREERGVIEFPFSMERGVRSEPYVRHLDDPNQFAVWCLTHRSEVFINDVDAEYGGYIDSEGMATLAMAPLVNGQPAARPVAMMYTPLVVKDRVVGVLAVQSVHRNAYRRVHLDMLKSLAGHAAVGLDNARAYQRLEEAMQALRQTQAQLLLQEKQVRLHTDELALANRALQENDERLRLAKQKAEDATRQKSEFLANMSHEMRTPLAGVIGMLGFALRDAQLQDSTRAQILRGQANAQSLLSIINDLLDFSKIEAGKLSIENIDFALGSAIENVVSLFEEQAAARSVDFSIEFGADLPPFVVGDPTRLRQVLVNLVGNAFKFTQSGSVKVSVERVGTAHHDGRGVNLIGFTVSDSGIGIEPDEMPRLFQKFEQADTTTTRRYGGTGLGLAICRQLVDLMDGEITADSTPGVGSVFRVVLPLPDGVAPPLVRQVPRAPHSHQLRVLCAEDFPTNQIIIRMMLEDLGHRVDIAVNGALAVTACAKVRYDLILMDGRMPEMDGATATRLIRAGGPPEAPVADQELMIIALTANASEEDRSRYLAAGMDDFLTKPIDEGALHFQLGRAIDRQLQRGFMLPLMPGRSGINTPTAGTGPSTAELDAMFGVVSGAVPLVSPPNPGRRSTDLKRRIRSAFSGDIAARLSELDRAVAARDNDTAGRLLHGIKGSAAYLDEMELHLLCSELEETADRGEWALLLGAMPQLRQLLASIGSDGKVVS